MADQYPRTNPSDTLRDKDAIGKNAQTAADRRNVWDFALNQKWPNEDIGKLERMEPLGGDYYIAMWTYIANNS